MNSADIRQGFLDFFASNGHTVVPSSSLVPGNDPTLLFTNAGMVQFKDVFLGADKRPYSRAASSQRCVRAGGKHNDLENVGYTARHHTFFEMLGNFSFGDYFKEDAIAYAWEFLTGVLGLPEDRLWVTVHVSDDEAADIWLKKIGVSAERFSRLDEDNFWQMGDTGPCGPCSEIFYDHGADVPGGPPGSAGDDLDRYIEIWNLVFMQYERSADGTLTPLPKPSIDTGMGLERIAAVMQGVHNNYDIDLFKHLISAAAVATRTADLANKSLRVIADHIRSCAFLVVDGVLPSNDGRGYVLRRIIRRALRHGHQLGTTEAFFHRLVKPLVEVMGDAYPELARQRVQVEKVLKGEEQQFAKTLEKGMGVLETALATVQGSQIPGDVIFQLYDTYGFPTDLTNDIARERGLSLDMDGYEHCMAEQKKRARAASNFGMDYAATLAIDGETVFDGYDNVARRATIVGLFVAGVAVDEVAEGQDAVVVLDHTPFYGESGGQVGDTGYLTTLDGRCEVLDCQKQGANHLHISRVLHGILRRGDAVTAEVDGSLRSAIALNHSATHLLHAALRDILGEHVLQKGSLVDAKRLRFDFAHGEAISTGQLKAVERRVNDEIRRNTPVKTAQMSMADAQQSGAMALFGEKYGETVRVLTMGDGFSVELCGGIHVNRTGDIGLLRIVSESGIAAGVRRVEAVTGTTALALFDELEQRLDAVAEVLKTNRTQVLEKATLVAEQQRVLSREIDGLKKKLAGAASGDILADVCEIAGVQLLVKHIDGVNAKTLREVADQAKSRLACGALLLAATDENKVLLIGGVTKNLTDRVHAGDLVQFVAAQLGGKGGGRPDMAQGGGTNIQALPAALTSVPGWLQQRLGG